MTGGGTAGHINPALAIAEIIRSKDPNAKIEFVGIRKGKETDLVPREGYPLHFVHSMGIKRSLSPSNVKALWMALTSPYAKETVSILRAFRPDLVIGTGGYACWPIMAAAVRMGIPTALHESNALPGLAVRRLQRKVDRVWVNFESTKERLHPKARTVRVGNPLRQDFGRLSREEARAKLGISTDRLFVLSFGGSLGAEPVNRAVLQMMRDFSSKHPSVLHLHAAGKRDYEASLSAYREMGLEGNPSCQLVDYIYDMPVQMAAADLIIARAGAMTLSELAGMNKASILIPSPTVADNHQYINAKTLADAGAASLVEESTLPEGRLTEEAKRLLSSLDSMREMGGRISVFADLDPAELIWREICELTQKNKMKK
ncbi:MAG: UDP-N-acetylglucosamine--N-acetylmuramyl-(pentapeptide) pyrophosphoryl-undecaprenol N-acetylglucosamine transferase [Clostridia bacterium]|nr:UDP-N-acetylglucosamine--N-acetylmuramyl-(pentapeptide) pyrophosphoryl-undecaprenol N-acetylglucosamine transferase [Clostridia bacterium]